MIHQIQNTHLVQALFADWEETMIWSCLEGIMGQIYVTDLSQPRSAMAILNNFIFYAGQPDMTLVREIPADCRLKPLIIIAKTPDWHPLIEQFYGPKARVITRYAIKKEPHIFQTDKLQAVVSHLPAGYHLQNIDPITYQQCIAEDWSHDLVASFPNAETYQQLGLGVVLWKEHSLIAGASSYSRYRKGIEIEIDTRADQRRQGFAYICGAQLILECLKHHLYPSWDAHNLASVRLAEKLGYHFSHAYPAYEIEKEPLP